MGVTVKKENTMTTEDKTNNDAVVTEKTAAGDSRREFLKKYGKLAAITPVAMTMTLHSKKALASTGCGTDCGPDSFMGGI